MSLICEGKRNKRSFAKWSIAALLKRISKLQEEMDEERTNQINLLGISKELKPNEVMVRNSPKVTHVKPLKLCIIN
jgi:hypothetical protein